MVLKNPIMLTGFQPHMHNRGTRMCLEAVYPDGRIETVNCAKHNFAWMLVYNYQESVAPLLPAGTILLIQSDGTTTAPPTNTTLTPATGWDLETGRLTT